MTKEHIDAVLAYTKRKWERGVSREEAIRRLQSIGLLDENCELAARFQHLSEWPPLNTPLRSELNEEEEMSVRGAFLEGAPAFEGSGIYEKAHIQICIRNPNCIKGFFLPRQERASQDSHYDISDASDGGFLVSEPREPYNV